METLRADGDTIINRPIEQVFEFLCNPDVDPAELTPMEDRFIEWNERRGIGTICRSTIEFAARELDCIARCVEFEPPQRLGMRLEGDLHGMQVWHLSREDDATRAQLSIDIEKPEWTPAYLRDQDTAAHWGRTLVEQVLENVKSALETPSVSGRTPATT